MFYSTKYNTEPSSCRELFKVFFDVRNRPTCIYYFTTCCDDVKNVNLNTLAVASACAHDLYLSYLDSFL